MKKNKKIKAFLLKLLTNKRKILFDIKKSKNVLVLNNIQIDCLFFWFSERQVENGINQSEEH